MFANCMYSVPLVRHESACALAHSAPETIQKRACLKTAAVAMSRVSIVRGPVHRKIGIAGVRRCPSYEWLLREDCTEVATMTARMAVLIAVFIVSGCSLLPMSSGSGGATPVAIDGLEEIRFS